MKSTVIVVTVLVAVLHARFVQTGIVTRVFQKQGHSSESEGRQSALISSRALQTGGNLSGPAVHPGSYEMNMPSSEDGKNGDQSYVLVPLPDLMRNRRASKAGHSGKDQDPLYVMFPFQEIIRKARDFDGNSDSNITLTVNSEVLGPYNSEFDKPGRRKRRGISTRGKWLLKNEKITKRRPHGTLSVRRERMSPSELVDVDYDDTLHGEPLTKHTRPNFTHFSVDQSDKKSKASLSLTDLKSQLHPEMFDVLHQKPRILTDLSDLNLSPKVLQTVIGKPKKSSVTPINITMFISNLIPPNEVENTRITNAGKLYKSGCLKFSIQLERPGSCSCPLDDSSDDAHGKSSCVPVVAQKVACGHPGAAEDKVKPVEGPSSSSPGNCGPVPAPKAQSAETAADTARSNDPMNSNRDVSSLLLQLIGGDKKLPKKPAATSGQTILMDNEVIKELQRLLSNQVASKGSDPADGKAMSATSAPVAAPIAPNSPKARAIAEALNFFSKYSSLKQNGL